MSPLPRFNILSRLNGLSAWLAISLAAHGAFFGWLVGQAQTSAGRSPAMLQVSLVTGGDHAVTSGEKAAPRFRGMAGSRPATTPPTTVQPTTELAVTVLPTPPLIPVAPAQPLVVATPLHPGRTEESVITALPGDAETTLRASGHEPVLGAIYGSNTTAGPGGGSSGLGGDAIREEARLARQIRPEYPPGALAQGWDGQVLLRLRVSIDGNVQQVRVERSSGHEILDRAALRAARNWLFFPAREAGVPVVAEVKVPVVFAREAL